MLGSRAIWADGWTAVTWHKKDTSWEDDRWELYHTDVDSRSYHSQRRPDKLRELQARWFEEARKYNVLPLDDEHYERTGNPTRPVAAIEKPSYYYPDTSILHPLAAPQTSRPRAHHHGLRGGAGGRACVGGKLADGPPGWQAAIHPQFSEDQGFRGDVCQRGADG